MNGIKIGVIGGSGLGQLLGGREGRRHELDTPFGRPSDAIVEAEWEGLTVLLLGRHGPGHTLNPTAAPYRANIFALKLLGCTHVIASGAVGSLRQEFKPRDLVIPEQVIDKTHRRSGTFFENAAVHVDFAEPFCPVMRRILVEAGKEKGESVASEASPRSDTQNPAPTSASESAAGAAQPEHAPSALPGPTEGSPSPLTVHDRGCYVCMEGPAFSSRAESLMHRVWGGDLIGMTAMPEAKLAREAEIPYALVALVTDYDSWKQKPPVPPPGAAVPPGAEAPPASPSGQEELLREIIANLQSASANAAELIRRALRRIAADPAALSACPASSALKLAIWSDKSRIPPDEVRRLSPLWGKYFG